MMTTSPQIAWQPSLLDASETIDVDATFGTLERVHLDDDSWVDHQPRWVTASDRLFDELLRRLPWAQRSRRMYDKQVVEPRLTFLWRASSGEALQPPILERMRALLSDRYGVEFDSAGFNLYRDGNDSVAWHGDRIRKEIELPTVVLVSLGAPRRFLLRPKGGRATRTFHLGGGDLLVTGGMTQRSWEHSVPKVAKAGARISIAFRHGLATSVYDNADATTS